MISRACGNPVSCLLQIFKCSMKVNTDQTAPKRAVSSGSIFVAI